ncbi:unnamed protein product [Paramecium sonneborni]|uniref:Uncharacterized protein n=1 Tax=Paramecium sonneborni TaxID=65129 RepID=A0A8S1R3F5_9CILI|nr:unnamed protein product [Paramecium sonneborni]
MRNENRREQNKIQLIEKIDVKNSPLKQLNSSINEDRQKRFDNSQDIDIQQQRAERMKLQNE